MKLFHKKKSLEGFLIQLEAKIVKENQEQESECLLEKQHNSGSHFKGVSSSSKQVNKNRNSKYTRNNNSSKYLGINRSSYRRISAANGNANSEGILLRETQGGNESELPNPNEVVWTNRKKLFLSLLLLGVLGFLAFFLVGTMAALKWFDSEDPEPRAIKLGEYRDRENPLKQGVVDSPTQTPFSSPIMNVKTIVQSVKSQTNGSAHALKRFAAADVADNGAATAAGQRSGESATTTTTAKSSKIRTKSLRPNSSKSKSKNAESSSKLPKSHFPFAIPPLASEVFTDHSEISEMFSPSGKPAADGTIRKLDDLENGGKLAQDSGNDGPPETTITYSSLEAAALNESSVINQIVHSRTPTPSRLFLKAAALTNEPSVKNQIVYAPTPVPSRHLVAPNKMHVNQDLGFNLTNLSLGQLRMLLDQLSVKSGKKPSVNLT